MKNRREFIVKSGLGILGLTLSPSCLHGAPALIKSFQKADSLINGVQVGCITYSFRSLPDQSAEAILQYVLDCGINAIELMGDPAESFAGMPDSPINRMRMFQLGGKQRRGEELDASEKAEFEDLRIQAEAYGKQAATWRMKADMTKFAQLRKMYNDAGVQIYAFKPNTFGIQNSDGEIAYGMQVAKILGASHVTLEHPSDDAQTLRLGTLGEKHKMGVAYHGHEQQTFNFWDTAIMQSKANGLNFDAGHYIAAGHTDILPLVEKQNKKIQSMHIKDRQTPAHGKGNLEWGKGDTPIVGLLQEIKQNKYKFPVTIELEHQIPEGSDAIKEVRACVEYCRKALA